MRSLLVVALVAGCGGGIALDAFPGALLAARCEFDVRCGLFTDVATCEQFLAQRADPSLAAAVAQGKSSYDADNAEQCANQIANADCNGTTMEGREIPSVCLGVVTGNGVMGDACASNSECQSLACNVPTCMMACCTGTCGPPNPKARLGEPCATRTCDVGLTCDNTKVCVALFAPGMPCTNGSQCAYGLGCAGASPTCVALPKLGEACTVNLPCAEIGATCVGGSCVKYGLPGDPCTSQFDCSPYATCDVAAGRCASFPTRGQPCTIACSDTSWCNIPSGMTTGTCDAPQANGASCVFGDACQTRFCDDSAGPGSCADPVTCI